MVKRLLKSVNEFISERLRVRMMRHAHLYPWQLKPFPKGSYRPNQIPEAMRPHLRSDNPRLLELNDIYRTFDPEAVKPAVWVEGKIDEQSLANFRGDNPYIFQLRGLNYNELGYALSYYALKGSSAKDLLDKFDEDGLFGVHTFRIDGRTISRDLLDSVREVDFIRTHVGLNQANDAILDIGAGYGRLPYRLSQATNGQIGIFATDAFAPSTFLSELYLRFRKADGVGVVPLNEVDGFLAKTPVTVATNVHSFSECSPESIEWWVSRLARHGVKYLFVIPNRVSETGRCITNTDFDMEDIFNRFGYQIRVREPRYHDPVVQKYAVDPAQLNLFALDGR